MTKKTFVQVGVLATLMTGSFALGTAVAKEKAPKLPELSLLKDAKWTPIMKEGPLPAVAAIQGDPTKGAYEGYLKLPAGFESPPHSHSYDYWAVLVQGKMTHWAANGGSEKDAKQLGVGDLTFMPAKVDHVSKCYPGADCIMVVVQKGKNDFIPAKAVAKQDKQDKQDKKDEKPATTAMAAAPGPAAAPAPAVPAPGGLVPAGAPAKTPAAAPVAAAPSPAAAQPLAPPVPAKTPAAAPVPAAGSQMKK
jgi:quercetin dioxygenase-like cupin family protein